MEVGFCMFKQLISLGRTQNIREYKGEYYVDPHQIQVSPCLTAQLATLMTEDDGTAACHAWLSLQNCPCMIVVRSAEHDELSFCAAIRGNLI